MRPLTVGVLMDYLQGFPPETPVAVDVNTDEGVYLRVEAEALMVTADQGPTDQLPDEVVLSWDPEPGWVEALLRNANDIRSELGQPPLGLK